MLAPPTKGFDEWRYINKEIDGGGRCIWTAPTSAGGNSGNTAGLDMAKTKFSSQEVSFNNAGTSQRFVVFITRPTIPANLDDHCKSE